MGSIEEAPDRKDSEAETPMRAPQVRTDVVDLQQTQPRRAPREAGLLNELRLAPLSISLSSFSFSQSFGLWREDPPESNGLAETPRSQPSSPRGTGQSRSGSPKPSNAVALQSLGSPGSSGRNKPERKLTNDLGLMLQPPATFLAGVRWSFRKRFNLAFFKKLLLMNLVCVLVVFYISRLPMSTSPKDLSEGDNYNVVPWFIGVEFVCVFFLMWGVCVICFNIFAANHRILFSAALGTSFVIILGLTLVMMFKLEKNFAFYGMETLTVSFSFLIIITAVILRSLTKHKYSSAGSGGDDSLFIYHRGLEARYKENYRNRGRLAFKQRLAVTLRFLIFKHRILIALIYISTMGSILVIGLVPFYRSSSSVMRLLYGSFLHPLLKIFSLFLIRSMILMANQNFLKTEVVMMIFFDFMMSAISRFFVGTSDNWAQSILILIGINVGSAVYRIFKDDINSKIEEMLDFAELEEEQKVNELILNAYEDQIDSWIDVTAVSTSTACLIFLYQHRQVIDFGFQEDSFELSFLIWYAALQIFIVLAMDILCVAVLCKRGKVHLIQKQISETGTLLQIIGLVGSTFLTVIAYRLVPIFVLCESTDVCSCTFAHTSAILIRYC